MTLPWGRGCYWLYWKSASFRGDRSSWSQLKTVWLLKDSLFCGWSPTERLTALLIDGWVFYMWGTSLLFHKKLCYHSVVKVGCGGSGTWDFSESRAMKGDAVTDFWESTNHLLTGSWEETNAEWIDNRCRRSFSSKAFWWMWKKTTNACSKEIQFCKHQHFSLKFSTYPIYAGGRH